jgi:hypothetical protein
MRPLGHVAVVLKRMGIFGDMSGQSYQGHHDKPIDLLAGHVVVEYMPHIPYVRLNPIARRNANYRWSRMHPIRHQLLHDLPK